MLRSDLPELLPDDPRAAAVAAATRTLAELLADTPAGQPPDLARRARRRATALPPPRGDGLDGRTRRCCVGAGADVDAVGGCCGLAGNFGVERGHYEVSVAVAETALLPGVRDAPHDAVVLADGFSCRTQLEQLGARALASTSPNCSPITWRRHAS